MDNNLNTTEISLEKLLSIWWAMIWRSVVFSMLLGFVLGFIGGVIVGMAGHPELGGAVGAVLGWLGSIPVSIWALKTALTKKYGDYSFVMVKDM